MIFFFFTYIYISMENNNTELKQLLLPSGKTSKQFLEGFYSQFPYVKQSKDTILGKPEWYFMGAQFYKDKDNEMKNDDIHNDFTDFIVNIARHQSKNIHNKLNNNIYENIYLNWDKLDIDVQKFYDSFISLYKKDSNKFVKVNNYNNLPKKRNNNYKMMMDMDGGGTTKFAKELPNLPHSTENIWFSTIGGELSKSPKSSGSDLITFYNNAFSNNINDNFKYGYSLKNIIGGSFDNGFDVDINNIINDVLSKITEDTIQHGGEVLNDEFEFNNLLMNSINNKDITNLKNCKKFINNNKLNSQGKVDIELASQTLKALGFYQNNEGILEPVTNWKIRANDNLKKKSIIRNINKPKNKKFLDHLTNIVNYINHVNYTGSEPQTIENKPFSNINLELQEMNNDYKTLSEHVNFDIDSLVKNMINESSERVQKNEGQSGGWVPLGLPLLPHVGLGKLPVSMNAPLNTFGNNSIATNPYQIVKDKHRYDHIMDNMDKLGDVLKDRTRDTLDNYGKSPLMHMGPMGSMGPMGLMGSMGPMGPMGPRLPGLIGHPGPFMIHPFGLNPYLYGLARKCNISLSKKDLEKWDGDESKYRNDISIKYGRVNKQLSRCLKNLGWKKSDDIFNTFKNYQLNDNLKSMMKILKAIFVLKKISNTLRYRKVKSRTGKVDYTENKIKSVIEKLAEEYGQIQQYSKDLINEVNKDSNKDKDLIDLILGQGQGQGQGTPPLRQP
jgi:hypothetical protein